MILKRWIQEKKMNEQDKQKQIAAAWRALAESVSLQDIKLIEEDFAYVKSLLASQSA